jgi:hypothetical protein
MTQRAPEELHVGSRRKVAGALASVEVHGGDVEIARVERSSAPARMRRQREGSRAAQRRDWRSRR